jgi:hypothetical protein
MASACGYIVACVAALLRKAGRNWKELDVEGVVALWSNKRASLFVAMKCSQLQATLWIRLSPRRRLTGLANGKSMSWLWITTTHYTVLAGVEMANRSEAWCAPRCLRLRLHRN